MMKNLLSKLCRGAPILVEEPDFLLPPTMPDDDEDRTLWGEVLEGRISIERAAYLQAMLGDSPEQIARDCELFRPMDAQRREAILNQVLHLESARSEHAEPPVAGPLSCTVTTPTAVSPSGGAAGRGESRWRWPALLTGLALVFAVTTARWLYVGRDSRWLRL